MPAITLSGLSWQTPDGRDLFPNLDLTFGPERTGLVGRNGAGKTTLLRLIAGDLTPREGSIAIAGTVGVLDQTPDAETLADLFGIRAALAILDRAEAGQASEADLADADWLLPSRFDTALSSLRLDAAPDTPLTQLSGGQRTRAALAALVFAEPDWLLLDEPTNHLDRDGRQAVHDLLAGWKGGAIVVSHDRELLDTMDSIVELTPKGATRYGGNWTHYRQRKAEDTAAAEATLADAEKRLNQTSHDAQTAIERKARKDSGGRKKAAKGDAPKIILGMMKNRSENTSGAAARLAERQRSDAEAALDTARDRIEIVTPMSTALPPSRLAAGKTVLVLDAVTAGYDPGLPVIRGLSLALTGPERLAILGANGSGKSTLLAVIDGTLKPWSGTADIRVPFARLDQSVSLLDPALSIRDNYRRLHGDADENTTRAALARFAFRADAALQTVGRLSGGQRLRAGLACTLGGPNPPQLLILDEPTNHLDIESIEVVEAGLKAYDGALIVVSHDERFLDALHLTRRLDLAN
ncbi:ABC-F family ATP-binding cassette domain-containing protein [Asticcacaulis solisilvae]|uniref:ABC-F family ATP-binding cassette domain-containing protein n=1 Tax=Asticcacaulis solisilvae TaxID=1217274 RepID=UPI003FD6FAFD